MYSFRGDYLSVPWFISWQRGVSVRRQRWQHKCHLSQLLCYSVHLTIFQATHVSTHTLRWQDWVREPSDAAELLTYCRCLLAHVTVWMMLGGPQVYSFYIQHNNCIGKALFWWQIDNVTTWRDIRPSMVTHSQNLCSAKLHTQQWTHKHRKHTPGAVGSHLCCGTRGAVGVRCLAQGHLSRGIEGGESAAHSLRPPTTTYASIL